MIKPIIYCLTALFIIAGCKSIKTPASADAELYNEDLSTIRPRYEEPEVLADIAKADREAVDYSSISPSADVTEKLNAILDSVDVLKKDVRYIDGFTIQVYQGTNSEEARLAVGKIYSLIPESDPQLKFDEPIFKVKIGKFYSKMEAQKLYSQLKETFPNAIIIYERIYI